jgi:hypothetical protein
MKQNEMIVYKGFGTYQLVVDDYDGERYYECRHIYSGQDCQASTVKEAKEVLEALDKTHKEIQFAIQKLTSYGYRVFKEVA